MAYLTGYNLVRLVHCLWDHSVRHYRASEVQLWCSWRAHRYLHLMMQLL